jgi:hypothetical protein
MDRQSGSDECFTSKETRTGGMELFTTWYGGSERGGKPVSIAGVTGRIPLPSSVTMHTSCQTSNLPCVWHRQHTTDAVFPAPWLWINAVPRF